MTNSISEAAKEARNAYLREWRKKNPERVKAIEARYWEKKAEKAMQEAAKDE